MAIITLQTLSGYWQAVSDWVTGANTSYAPKVTSRYSDRTSTVLTTTVLGASATYTQTGVDSTAYPQVNSVGGRVYADQTGTLYLEVSDDNTTWDTQTTMTVSANTPAYLSYTPILGRYFRFRYVNGTTAQTTFRLVQVAKS